MPLQININPGHGCSARCQDCVRSVVFQGGNSVIDSLSDSQALLVSKALEVCRPDDPSLVLSYANCITRFSDNFQFPDLGGRGVDHLLLYISTPEASVENILTKMRMFLRYYSNLSHLILVVFHGNDTSLLQRTMLLQLLPKITDVLEELDHLKSLTLSFGGNDFRNQEQSLQFDRDVDSTLTAVVDSSITPDDSEILGIRQRLLKYTLKADKRDEDIGLPGINFDYRREIRDIILQTQGKLLWLGSSKGLFDPTKMTLGHYCTLAQSLEEPSLHISRSTAYLHHHRVFMLAPGIHVTHDIFHAALDRYKHGEPWSQIVQQHIFTAGTRKYT